MVMQAKKRRSKHVPKRPDVSKLVRKRYGAQDLLTTQLLNISSKAYQIAHRFRAMFPCLRLTTVSTMMMSMQPRNPTSVTRRNRKTLRIIVVVGTNILSILMLYAWVQLAVYP